MEQVCESEGYLKFQPATMVCDDLKKKSHQPLNNCFQCQKCTNGCPMKNEMDLKPHEIVRLVQLGDRERLLNSKSIWICVSCKTCKARCPNGIDTSKLIDLLRMMTISGNAAQGNKVALFQLAFLENVKYLGRVFELGMMGLYKLKSKTYFDDFALGLELIKRQKLKFWPSRIRKIQEVKKIFQVVKEKSL